MMVIKVKMRLTAPQAERWIAFWSEDNDDLEYADVWGSGPTLEAAIKDLIDNYELPDLEVSF